MIRSVAMCPIAQSPFRRLCLVLTASLLLGLGGCGGSSPHEQTPDPKATTFTGTVINDDGTVASAPTASAKAASGVQRTSTSVPGTTTYTLDAAGLTAPYVLRNSSFTYSGGTAGPIALSLQTGLVNITALTDLQAQAIFGLSTSTIFTGFGSVGAPASMVTTASLATARTKVLDFLKNTLGVTVSSGIGDFATSTFPATAGDPMFDTLTSLAARKQALGSTYDTLVATFVNEAHLCNAQQITVAIGSATAVDFCPSTRTANRETADATIVDAVFVNQAGAVLTVRVRDTVVLGASYQLAGGGATYTCTGNACAITVSAADATTGGLPLTFLKSPLAGTSDSAVLNGTLLSAEPAAPPAPLPCPTTAAAVTLTIGGIALDDFCPASVAAPQETADPTIVDASFTDATGSTLTVRVQGSTVLDATYASASGFSYTCSGSACAITVGTAAASGALPLTFSQSTLTGATDTAVINGTLLSAVPGASSGPPACLANASLFQLTVGGETAVFCPSTKTAVREATDQTIVDATIGNTVGTLTVRFHSDTAVVVDAVYVDTASNSYACSGTACAITVGTPDATTGAVPLTFAASTLTGTAGTAVLDGTVSTATPPALLPTLSCDAPYEYFLVLPNQSVIADCIPDRATLIERSESGFIASRQGYSSYATYPLYGIDHSSPTINVILNQATGAIVSITAVATNSTTGAVTLDYKCRGSDCNGVAVSAATDEIDSSINFSGLPVSLRSVTLKNTKLAMVNSDGSLSTSVYATLSGNFTGVYTSTADTEAYFFTDPPTMASYCASATNRVSTAPADESVVYGICPELTNMQPSPGTFQKADGGLSISLPQTYPGTNTPITYDYVMLTTDATRSVTSVVVSQNGINTTATGESWGCSGTCSGVTVSAPDGSGNYTVTFSNATMHVVEPDGFPTGARTAVVNGTFTAPAPTAGVVVAGARSRAASRERLVVPQATPLRRQSGAATK